MTRIKTIDDIENVVTIAETMLKLNIRSRTTIYNWIELGTLKTTKIGKRRFVPVSEIDRLIKQGTRYGL